VAVTVAVGDVVFDDPDQMRDLLAPRLERRPANITIHETADPEVIVAEFEYRGTNLDTGEPFVQPAIFVLRVRDGQIVESRDYFDHLTAARIRGQAV